VTESTVEGGPLYLALEDVLALYAEIFSCSEREARDQLRDRAGLESALSRPEMYAHYQAADLAMQAAVLAHAIAEGQYFVDGNKRTALAACLTFLRINGYDVTASQKERADWILGLSHGRTVEERLASRLRSALDPPL
jgi:death on curing protein